MASDMNLLILDNYDSFTYNIVHALRSLGVNPVVKRNDCISLEDVGAFDRVLVSPGPGIPAEAGILLPMLRHYALAGMPIMGVCLGHQAIGQTFGARLVNLPTVFHGLQTEIEITVPDEPLFHGLEHRISVGRYHSWAIDTVGFPHNELRITATDSQGIIMAVRHRSLDVCGVQFHPESILTPQGTAIFSNWLQS